MAARTIFGALGEVGEAAASGAGIPTSASSPGELADRFRKGLIPYSPEEALQFLKDAVSPQSTPPLGIGEVPETKVRSDYAAQIMLNGQTVGGVFEMAVEQTRAVEDVWTVRSRPDGLPQDTIGQGLTGRSLRLQRYDLWTEILEYVFGLSPEGLLSSQCGVLTIRELWKGPSNNLSVWDYVGNRFVSLGRTIGAHGDRIVKAGATFNWQRKKRA